MSCLTIKTKQNNKNLIINTNKQEIPTFEVNTQSRNTLYKVEQQSSNLEIDVECVSTFMYYTISLICRISTDKYLSVEPDVVWVSPELIKELLIKSNVDWIIQ